MDYFEAYLELLLYSVPSLANATLYLVFSLKATKPQALHPAYISFHFISCCVVSSVFSVFINVIALSAACLRALLPRSRCELKIPSESYSAYFQCLWKWSIFLRTPSSSSPYPSTRAPHLCEKSATTLARTLQFVIILSGLLLWSSLCSRTLLRSLYFLKTFLSFIDLSPKLWYDTSFFSFFLLHKLLAGLPTRTLR